MRARVRVSERKCEFLKFYIKLGFHNDYTLRRIGTLCARTTTLARVRVQRSQRKGLHVFFHANKYMDIVVGWSKSEKIFINDVSFRPSGKIRRPIERAATNYDLIVYSTTPPSMLCC
jgi:hypothetical protein